MTINLMERSTLTKATATAKGNGLWRVRIIDAGQGSSGFYPAATLEAAVPLFTAGTQMFLDHATEAQDWERPEGSLERLVGVLAKNAEWNPTANAIEADVKVYSHWRPLLEGMADDIGLSIRAMGTAEVQDINGSPVPVITALTEVVSVDYVTRAGRGGRVLQVLESATQAPSKHLDPEYLALAMHPTGAVAGQVPRHYYIESSDTPNGVGSEPNNPPSGGDTTTNPKESNVEITKDEYDRLTAAAGRVSALEAERDTANTKATEAAAKLAERDKQLAEALKGQTQAAIAARVAESTLPDLAKQRITADLADVAEYDETTVAEAIRREEDYAKALTEAARTTATPSLGNGPATTVTESAVRHTRSPWGTDYTKES